MTMKDTILTAFLLTAIVPAVTAMTSHAAPFGGVDADQAASAIPRHMPGPMPASGMASFYFAGVHAPNSARLIPMELASLVVTTPRHQVARDPANAAELESWIAAALAGAFGAFWVNRQVMEGVPTRHQLPHTMPSNP